ncbi:DNA/RNA nuclease SfsA [Minwuia sp.]|uniref:DNA/RNA nuclease SfsA n=1 Tax=Minwuia sp. TaxID=2493630 RepID=UPI003A93BF2E
MEFPSALTEARLIRRYKRFLADVELPSGEVVTAHCPNPGSMLSLIEPEASQTVWLSHSADPKRKLAWSLELLQVADTLVCVNTQRPNRAAEEAVAAGEIPELSGYDTVRREVRYGEGSRIDLLLQKDGRPDCYVEIKSVTMSRQEGLIEFPDSVTKRGRKHLIELSGMAARGHRSVMLFLSPRADGRLFRPAADIDPAYAEALLSARHAGVELLCYTCAVSPGGIYPAGSVPVEVD